MRRYHVDFDGVMARLQEVPPEEREQLLNHLDDLAELAEVFGAPPGHERVNLCTFHGNHMVLYQLDARERALVVVDLVQRR